MLEDDLTRAGYKKIVGFPKYRITNDGNIWITDMGRIMKSFTSARGYEVLALWNNRKRTRVMVHRLVAIAFVRNNKCLRFVRHKDENRKNNCSDNLEWYGTYYKKEDEKIPIYNTRKRKGA